MYTSQVGPLDESAELLTLKLLKRRDLPCAVQILYMCRLTGRNSEYDNYPKFNSSNFPSRFIGLHAAAYFGLEGDIDTKDDRGRTPLHWACTRGHEDIASLLIASKVGRVNINSRDYRQ